MKFSWKDTAATTGVVVIIGLVIALMMGAFESIDGRWALGTFAVLLVGGLTGLITGTAGMMQKAWSSVALYILTASALVITLANAFLNSEAWLVAMGAVMILLWLEFVSTDLLGRRSGTYPRVQSGGTV